MNMHEPVFASFNDFSQLKHIQSTSPIYSSVSQGDYTNAHTEPTHIQCETLTCIMNTEQTQKQGCFWPIKVIIVVQWCPSYSICTKNQ